LSYFIFFIADYLEDPGVTEGTLLTTSDKKTTPVVTGVVKWNLTGINSLT
jgi:hypothetical protein